MEELPHQTVKGFDGEYVGYETVLFGGARFCRGVAKSSSLIRALGTGVVQHHRSTHTGLVWTTRAQSGEEPSSQILEQGGSVIMVVGRWPSISWKKF